jgi:hypothetical protein
MIFCSLESKAQFTKTITLRPIYKQGWKYFYDGKRMNSVYALQIPLQSLDNKEINDRFKRFKRLQVLGGLAYLPALIYLFSNNHLSGGRYGYRSRKADYRTYLELLAGGIVVNITMNELAHHQMAKAIDIYNIQISDKSTLGLSFNRLNLQNYPGITYHLKFK